MNDTKPWRKLWRDINRDTRFLELPYMARTLFTQLLVEMDDDGMFTAPDGIELHRHIGWLVGMPPRHASKALAALMASKLLVVDSKTVTAPAFTKRQTVTSASVDSEAIDRPTRTAADRSRAYRQRHKRNAANVTPVTDERDASRDERNDRHAPSHDQRDDRHAPSRHENVSSSSSASGKIEDFRPQISETEGASARETKQKRKRPQPKADTTPLPGTLARRVYDAIVADPVLGPITVNPGDFAERATNPDAHKCTVLAEVLKAGEWASRQPPSAQPRDGRRFLANWLSRADADTAATPRPALLQHPNLHRGPLPAATAQDFAESKIDENDPWCGLGPPRGWVDPKDRKAASQ